MEREVTLYLSSSTSLTDKGTGGGDAESAEETHLGDADEWNAVAAGRNRTSSCQEPAEQAFKILGRSKQLDDITSPASWLTTDSLGSFPNRLQLISRFQLRTAESSVDGDGEAAFADDVQVFTPAFGQPPPAVPLAPDPVSSGSSTLLTVFGEPTPIGTRPLKSSTFHAAGSGVELSKWFGGFSEDGESRSMPEFVNAQRAGSPRSYPNAVPDLELGTSPNQMMFHYGLWSTFSFYVDNVDSNVVWDAVQSLTDAEGDSIHVGSPKGDENYTLLEIKAPQWQGAFECVRSPSADKGLMVDIQFYQGDGLKFAEYAMKMQTELRRRLELLG